MPNKRLKNDYLIELYLDEIILPNELSNIDDITLKEFKDEALVIRNNSIRKFVTAEYSLYEKPLVIERTINHYRFKNKDNLKKEIVASYIEYPDDQEFIEVLKATGYKKEDYEKFLKIIANLKHLSNKCTNKTATTLFQCIAKEARKIIDFKHLYNIFYVYYGTFNLELILSKISLILAKKPELFEEKQKVK